MIKLLELPTLQLEQRIKKELEENPALDEGQDEEEDVLSDVDQNENEDDDSKDDDEFSLEDYMEDDDDTPAYKLTTNNTSKDDDHKEIPYSAAKSFHEHLSEQLMMKELTDREKLLAVYLIGNIDDDGYLRRELDAVVDDIAFSQNLETSVEELQNVLEVVKELDPAGIGAQSLQECLILQLERKENQNVNVKTAKKILLECFDEFTKKHYPKIMSKCSLNDVELKSAVDVILKLNPKPGSSFGEPQTRSIQAIVPDFILDIQSNKIEISLNSRNAPELKINKSFAQMLNEYASTKNSGRSNKDAVVFIKQKIDSAKWFIDAIIQRQNTLLFTMNAIADFQKEFFLSGDETNLKPMILKDIAEITGLDISTISRVANSKYVSTPYGNYSLKYFFSEGMQTDTGEEVSTREIKQILKDCIGAENKSKPLTDDKLAEILKSKGYQIARRTVAKYREQLDIPVARLRKEL